MDLGLQGRVAMITGRGSHGLGKQSAAALGREGCKIAICARGAEQLAFRQAPQGTLRLRGRTGSAPGQQRRRAQPAPPGDQPQDQRRHPLEPGHRRQDDPELPLRHLAGPGPKPPHRLPPTTHFPSTLNSYKRESRWLGCTSTAWKQAAWIPAFAGMTVYQAT